MPRIRTIKPDFFTSRSVASLPLSARITFAGLWTYVDDDGRGIDDARLIKAAIWPLDDDHTSLDVERDLRELERRRLIVRYAADEKPLLAIRNWYEHQRVNKPTPSKLPAPPESAQMRLMDVSGNGHGELPDSDNTIQGGKGKERKGKETPNPEPAGSGRCNPEKPIHAACRACGTNPRKLAKAARTVETARRFGRQRREWDPEMFELAIAECFPDEDLRRVALESYQEARA